MSKSKLLTFLSLIVIFMACQNEPQTPASSTDTDLPSEIPTDDQSENSDKLAELKKNAFDEGDTFGRVNHSLGLIQKQFVISNQLNTPKGKQSIFVDERFTVLIRSEVGDDVIEEKVNLKNLDQQNGGMRLIADVKAGDLPGFAISVIEGKPGVEIIKNGKKIGEERELKIFMADRTLIEQSVPAFLQALNVVHGRN